MSEIIKTYNILQLEDDKSCVVSKLPIKTANTEFCICTAENFIKAKELLESVTFDAFILDIEIKDSRLTGTHFAEELRLNSLYSNTPIIFTSIHSHFSFSLLNRFKHSAFIPKPITADLISKELCIMLGIKPYVKAHYTYENLIILTQSDITLKLAPNKISFIELIDKDILISYTDGKCVKIPCKYGVFKNILSQISMRNISCLRQIYRSIIINVNQIANIQINRNIGNVYLFGEDKPKPLGIKYRCNLQEFISEV